MAEEAERDKAVFQNLIDAGCERDLVERFFRLQSQGRDRAQIGLLCDHRRKLLDRIHEAQRRLDCLDYLLYQLRRKYADQ